MHYTLSEFASITNGTIEGNENAIITSLSTDSRSFSAGNQLLFVALVGVNHDGHSFINDLVKKGITNFLVERIPSGITANFVKVENTKIAFQTFAMYHRAQFSIPVVGITGSNGKTVVKEWLNQLLSPFFSIVRSPKSYNSQIGVPLSVLQMEKENELAIFEAGISEVGEMQKLQPIVSPSIGIFTNIGEAHQENFESKIQKAKEKFQLFQDAMYLIYCSDYAEIQTVIQKEVTNQELIVWSSGEGGNVKFQSSDKDTEIKIFIQKKAFQFTIPFTDHASIENSIHCFFVLHILEKEVKTELISKANFEGLQTVGMRLEMVHGINGCTLINDAYNSDLTSLRIALEALTQQNQHQKRSVILSDIFMQPGHFLYSRFFFLSRIVWNAGYLF